MYASGGKIAKVAIIGANLSETREEKKKLHGTSDLHKRVHENPSKKTFNELELPQCSILRILPFSLQFSFNDSAYKMGYYNHSQKL